MSLLDQLLIGIKRLLVAGSPISLPPGVTPPQTLNAVSGATIVYNPLTGNYDATFGSSSLLPQFSPVNLMSAVNANAGSSYDVFTAVSSNTTVGTGFYVQDTANAHVCSGARGVWAGAATTLKISLWKFTGPDVATRVTSVAIAVGAGNVTPVTWTASFASAASLTPGVFFCITMWDESGTSYTGIGTLSNNNSILAYMLPAQNSISYFPANNVYTYAICYGTTGTANAFSMNGNAGSGDVQPIYNSTTKYIPIEPVIV